MTIHKMPGFSLLIVGILLMFIVMPIIDGFPFVGGLLQSMTFVIGLLGIAGGAYLLLRALTGAGR